MSFASIVWNYLSDRIASEKERQTEYDQWQAKIDEIKAEIEESKTNDEN